MCKFAQLCNMKNIVYTYECVFVRGRNEKEERMMGRKIKQRHKRKRRNQMHSQILGTWCK